MQEWTDTYFEEWMTQADDFVSIALLEASKTAVQELDKRKIQAEGQLDGLAWNKEEWES